MTKNLFPKSIRKYLRRRKAQLRRTFSPGEAEEEIQKLIETLRKNRSKK